MSAKLPPPIWYWNDDLASPSAPPEPENEAMERVWLSFFNSVFEIAEKAVRSRMLPLIDIRQEEPYLYLGLIGATVLRCAQRSARCADPTTLVLADGEIPVSVSALPDRHRAYFEIIRQVTSQIPSDPDHYWCLEQLVLYGQSEHRVVTSLDAATVVTLRRLSAMIQSVAIHISQQSIFRNEFKNVLGLLLQVYREL